jgi:hypothetical protein
MSDLIPRTFTFSSRERLRRLRRPHGLRKLFELGVLVDLCEREQSISVASAWIQPSALFTPRAIIGVDGTKSHRAATRARSR